ncbi:hypothetical protein BJ878DRAFT_545761 [Calycina marina]|uniref:Ribosomal RNA methyltransferase FtsJ domain-containing protein n=1 Tax=Calycina marina TaxID=1763456 RepID=A0A9P7YWZ5_9HELO|nr:hypothetical protein BJ878DRAFT_545761 [Calycina marina]
MSQESCFDIDKGAVHVIEIEAPIEVIETNPVKTPSPITIFHQRLRQAEPVYTVLMDSKEKGRQYLRTGIVYQRQRADTTIGKAAARFYPMMQEIGDEMQAATGAFCQNNRSEDEVGILDLCMVPGGYTGSALKYNPTAKAAGITLPPDKGGHEVLLNSYRSTVLYHDITIFAKEFGVDEAPCTHPRHDSFSLERPFIDQRFDFVMCDGQVLRTHKRPEYRERTEATRLTSSQLILALQRIRHGGTLIILLHKIEALDIMELLHLFSQFSDIEVFKPLRKHAIRSTFYPIAKNVQPSVESARVAVISWKKAWWNATYGGEQGVGAQRLVIDNKYAQGIIDSFGDRFTTLARPVWKIQADALSRTDFTR